MESLLGVRLLVAPKEGTGMMDAAGLRNEYFMIVELLAFEQGGPDRASLAAVLREARGALPDDQYVGLQGDIKTLLQGGVKAKADGTNGLRGDTR